jgi:pimeloyl-ACP methyl ester carboxylesterase
MTSNKTISLLGAALGAWLLGCSSTPAPRPEPSATRDDPVAAASSAEISVNGTTLHYTRQGTGPAVVLLHGFPEDSSAYRAIVPELARRFTVVAPDLRGVGASAPARDGYAFDNLAEDIHRLMQELALEPAFVVGHDIGGIVAYTLARTRPAAVRGVMLLEAPVPGLEPWGELRCSPDMWHMAFFQSKALPELLLAGREAVLVRAFVNGGLEQGGGVSEDVIARYAQAYAAPERLHAGLAFYRALPESERLNAARREPSAVPMVIVGSERGFAQLLPALARALGEHGWSRVTSEVVADSGHYLLDERPQSVVQLIERHAG